MMLGADQLSLLRPRWPLDAFRVSENGRFGVRRFNASQGSCGTSQYPCTHPGADLQAPEGTIVRVPFPGYVLYHGPADNPPFQGYGPYVALIAHLDTETPLLRRVWEWATGPLVDILDMPEGAVSTRYSLIAHLAPPDKRPGEVEVVYGPQPEPSVPLFPLVGDIWDAAKPKPNPDHWRVMKAQPSTVVMYTDADGRSQSRMVYAGQKLGTVSNANHVHWELRTAPIKPNGAGAWRLDPVDVFNQAYGLPLPSGVSSSRPGLPAPRGGGGGAGALLLLAALAFSKRKRRR